MVKLLGNVGGHWVALLGEYLSFNTVQVRRRWVLVNEPVGQPHGFINLARLGKCNELVEGLTCFLAFLFKDNGYVILFDCNAGLPASVSIGLFNDDKVLFC